MVDAETADGSSMLQPYYPLMRSEETHGSGRSGPLEGYIPLTLPESVVNIKRELSTSMSIAGRVAYDHLFKSEFEPCASKPLAIVDSE